MAAAPWLGGGGGATPEREGGGWRRCGRPHRRAVRGEGGGRRRGEEEDGRWARGKMVYLHLRSAENEYYNCYDVLQTKSSIHGVLETILNFVVCYTQNYTFTVSCRQISQLFFGCM